MDIINRIIKMIVQLFFLALFIILILFVYFNLSTKTPDKDYQLGVTFSQRYAQDLGLNWKEAYTAILEDLRVKKIRIPVYWDLVEKQKDKYEFADLDYQLNQAAKHKAEVILVIGQRVPRWPECFIPAWIENDKQREKELLEFIEITVERYKGREEVKIWQVENEPFLVFFGQCPKFNPDLLDKEIALVKKLDSRPTLITDSGELSIWYRAAKRADIFGTTMYRTIYKKPIGNITYPIGPNFFKFKTWLIKTFAKQDKVIVVELQAEPWTGDWITDVPVEDQLKLMNEDKLSEHVEYARKGNFTEIYLWGAEWWYWLKKEKEYNNVWNRAKELINH